MFPALLSIFGLFLTAEAEQSQPSVMRSMTIEQRLIVRVPIRPLPPSAFHWEERKGPKCFPIAAIAGSFISGKDSVDFILRNRQRIRAKFDSDCDGLDFYGGLYVQPEDGVICAKRDVIRSRIGGSCRIEKLKALVPQAGN